MARCFGMTRARTRPVPDAHRRLQRRRHPSCDARPAGGTSRVPGPGPGIDLRSARRDPLPFDRRRLDLVLVTFRTELLVLNVQDGALISRVEPLPFGRAGALVDMVILDQRMYLLADGDAIIELDLENPRRPAVLEIRDSADSACAPGPSPPSTVRCGSPVKEASFAGAIPSRRDCPASRSCSPVVSVNQGLAVPVGRRVHLLEDGAYLGAATWMEPLPQASGLEGKYLFILPGGLGSERRGHERRRAAGLRFRGAWRGEGRRVRERSPLGDLRRGTCDRGDPDGRHSGARRLDQGEGARIWPAPVRTTWWSPAVSGEPSTVRNRIPTAKVTPSSP